MVWHTRENERLIDEGNVLAADGKKEASKDRYTEADWHLETRYIIARAAAFAGTQWSEIGRVYQVAKLAEDQRQFNAQMQQRIDKDNKDLAMRLTEIEAKFSVESNKNFKENEVTTNG